MEFDNTFTVEAPIDEVWKAMLDVERVAPCVPGAKVLEQTGDNAYKVAIKVKLGPVSLTYTGNVEVAEADDAAHRAIMKARAKEQRGQGTADATVELRLTEQNGTTQGAMHSDVAISGRAAAMGRGMIGDVSAKMIDTFAENLAAMLSGPEEEAVAVAASEAAPSEPEAAPPPPRPAPEPAAAATDEGLPIGSIVGSVVTGRLQDPRALVGTLLAVLLIGWLLGRRSAR
jgi:carbon monoxide dehydrogenase subunit G